MISSWDNFCQPCPWPILGWDGPRVVTYCSGAEPRSTDLPLARRRVALGTLRLPRPLVEVAPLRFISVSQCFDTFRGGIRCGMKAPPQELRSTSERTGSVVVRGKALKGALHEGPRDNSTCRSPLEIEVEGVFNLVSGLNNS